MRHIVNPLFRHRLMPLLVMLQVALACAIACNALFLLQQRLVPILAPDGVRDPGHLIVVWNLAARGKPWSASRLREVEATLRSVPGVAAVSVAADLPMITNASVNGDLYGADTKAKGNAVLYIGDGLVQTLGLQLVAGRDFSASEVVTVNGDMGLQSSGLAIITQALADRLFPDGHALGRTIRIGRDADAGTRIVIGVVAHLMRNEFGQDSRENIGYSMLLPGVPARWPVPVFAVRAATADVEQVRNDVKATIQRELGAEMLPGFEPTYETYQSLRDRTLAASRAAVWLLAGVSIVVLIVTLAGIMGLTAYWVQQRTRQIGIRRALGARRSDILHDVQIENLLVVGSGVVVGLFTAYAVNLWLMRHYELARLPWQYLPFGAMLMLLLGQLAVLAPALRAAKVPPVVATRSG